MQMSNRIRILVMLQTMWLNISYQLYVITKISVIISTYLTAEVYAGAIGLDGGS